MSHLVLLRHGQSVWNRSHRFTGWSDVAVTPKGVDECEAAGRLLSEAGLAIDAAFTSVLSRGIASARAALRGLGQPELPLDVSWRLNERHFGALQGMGRFQAVRAFGLRRVLRLQASYGEAPPPLAPEDGRAPARDALYAHVDEKELPLSESLADCYRRVAPYWQEAIVPQLRVGRSLLIVAHKNSLRVLVQRIEGLADDEVPKLVLPTGVPLVYRFGPGVSLEDKRFLGASVRPRRRLPGLSPA